MTYNNELYEQVSEGVANDVLSEEDNEDESKHCN